MKKNWYVYIVRCSDGFLYTGITTNVARRIGEHNNQLGAKSLTKRKLPVKLMYKEMYPNQKGAARREKEIKSWRKEKKLKLFGS